MFFYIMWIYITKWGEDLHVRWNFVNGYTYDELEDKDIVFWHYTIPEHEVHQK